MKRLTALILTFLIVTAALCLGGCNNETAFKLTNGAEIKIAEKLGDFPEITPEQSEKLLELGYTSPLSSTAKPAPVLEEAYAIATFDEIKFLEESDDIEFYYATFRVKGKSLFLHITILKYSEETTLRYGGAYESAKPKFDAELKAKSNIVLVTECEVNIQGEDTFTIKGHKARALYDYVFTYVSDTDDDFSIPSSGKDNKSVALNFKGKLDENNNDSECGYFQIYKSGYMQFSSSPLVSYAQFYSTDKDTYDTVLSMVK